MDAQNLLQPQAFLGALWAGQDSRHQSRQICEQEGVMGHFHPWASVETLATLTFYMPPHSVYLKTKHLSENTQKQ